jgi:hypothetical protein
MYSHKTTEWESKVTPIVTIPSLALLHVCVCQHEINLTVPSGPATISWCLVKHNETQSIDTTLT